MSTHDPNTKGTFIIVGVPYGLATVHLSQGLSLVEIEARITESYPTHRFQTIHVFDLKPSSNTETHLPGIKLRSIRMLHPHDVNSSYAKAIIANASLAKEDEERLSILHSAIRLLTEEVETFKRLRLPVEPSDDVSNAPGT